ncbi:MAG: polysaccharide deacetylase 2 family uncharacterized protein YibQ [Oleiphilaceae bacterium]|jgi:polysaccharide deacetylase 2 family uncharacterized protein YibQ
MNFFQRKQRFTVVFVIILASLFSSSSFSDSVRQPTIAIIIDDMGNQYQNGLDLVLLPYPLTLSFLPNRPHSRALSSLARQYDKEIMLHSPMENQQGFELGIGGLVETMSEQEIKSTLSRSFKAIPNMVGINNHMGSILTTKPKIMKWVMEKIQEHPFYFVDSRTSADSVAAQTAKEFHIPTLSRDVFLDHHQTRKFVQQQFLKLIEIAKKNGTAVAIAHPHKVTVDYLSWALPKLDEKGVRIATISALWHIRYPNKEMHTSQKTPKSNWLNASKTIAQQSKRTIKINSIQ